MDDNTIIRGRLIKELDKDDRPREKALKNGIKTLSDAELMAIIFSTGIKGKSVIELSEDILRDNKGHLSYVTKLSVKEFLEKYKGIGPAKAITLLAALELGARQARDARLVADPVVQTAETAYDIMRHRFERLRHEEFWIMLLSQAGRVIKEVKIGQGGVAGTTADVKIILKEAIESLASSMILFHNHPSGNLKPSNQDDMLTQKITKAAALVDIRVNDHIIISDCGYYSFMENGRMSR